MPKGYLPRSPRLRRSSGITRLAMGAAVDALNRAGLKLPSDEERLGLILCVMNGCVDFTGRFYSEVLDTPALASPILFPETVFNAPASHVAQALGIDGPVSTLIGEPTNVFEGLRMASTWLGSGLVGQCLVVAAEEHSWLSAEATAYYHRDLVASEGAAAFLLRTSGRGPQLQAVEGPFPFLNPHQRADAARSMVTCLLTDLERTGCSPEESTLVDGQIGIAALDRFEADAWRGRAPVNRWSPKALLGESMGASAGLQVTLACAAAHQRDRAALVSSPGYNAAAYGTLILPDPNPPPVSIPD